MNAASLFLDPQYGFFETDTDNYLLFLADTDKITGNFTFLYFYKEIHWLPREEFFFVCAPTLAYSFHYTFAAMTTFQVSGIKTLTAWKHVLQIAIVLSSFENVKSVHISDDTFGFLV